MMLNILYISARGVLSEGYMYRYYRGLYKELCKISNVKVYEGIAAATRAQRPQTQQETPQDEQEATEDPIERAEDMAKESSRVIANAPDDVKDQISDKINEALPQKIYAFETENSVGEKAIGFKNEAGEDTGEMIFFS